MEKKWDKDEISFKLKTDIKWLTRGVLAIYARQTEDEKRTESTNRTNYKGFTGADAKFLSSIAKQIQKGKSLTEKQLYVTRKRMDKYSNQLAKIANKKL